MGLKLSLQHLLNTYPPKKSSACAQARAIPVGWRGASAPATRLAREHGHTQVEQFFLDKMNPVQVALYHVESFLGDQLSRAKQFASDLLN